MMQISGSERLRFGAYEADLHTHELWKHGTRIKLVGQPFEILAVMLGRPGQLITRDELRAELWPGDTFVDFNHGLNAAVNKLRDALCDSADDPKYIETLPRRGYRFIAAVEKSPAPSPAEPTAVVVNQGQQIPLQNPVAVADVVSPDSDSGDETPAALARVPVLESGPPPRSSFFWLRYSALAVVLILGLWRIADHLESAFHEKFGKKAAEAAGPSTLTPLTSLSDRTGSPAFSPDGTRVAFRRESIVPGNSGIWVKQVGGEELVQLTNGADDAGPVWSPKGNSIAFSRLSDKQRIIYEVPAMGGATHVLYGGNLISGHTEIDWSPDGNTIAFAAKGRQNSSAIFLLSLENKAVRQITVPEAGDEDWGPAFSPDGSRIAFVRSSNIMIMPADGGELRRLTSETVSALGSPAWAPDRQSVIFASILTASGHQERVGLWRIPASGGIPSPIREAGELVWNPAIAKRGFRLACEVSSSARSIDEMDLYPPDQKARPLVTTVSGENGGLAISPDGRRIAFESDRTGGLDIWMSDRNGQNPIQLTATGTAGAPRWSPDGKEIVFDVGLGRDWREPRSLFLVNTDGGLPRPLLQDTFSNPVPRWSHDGKWIYFASNRSGDWQIWKIQKSGGSPEQVTKQGGFAAEESFDGQYLYYAKHNYESPEIWRMPVAGGNESPVYPGIRPLDWAAWTVLENGIMFVGSGSNGVPTVSFYDFSAQGVRHLAVLDKPPFWLTATSDGKTVIFDQPGQEESHIMLLENFH
jgi:DNA-binding winged helix-turn-helix (wHTH) protein/dipeptidyl aminopeptidase/acylaminoacyl peptidase